MSNGARILLAIGLLALAAGNVAVTILRSTIPLELHGRVGHIDLRFEKHRGVDDVYLVTIRRDGRESGARDGTTLHVDTAIGKRLRVGDRIDKKAWTRTLQTPRGAIRLGVSRDVRGMLPAMLIVAIAGLAALAGRRR